MSTLNYIGNLLGIKAEYIKNMRETSSEYLLYVESPVRPHRCPNCHSQTTRIKGYTNRKIQHTTTNEKTILLLYRQRRYICTCGRTFNEKTEFSSRYLRTTPRLREVICQQLSEVTSYKAVAKHCHVSVNQVLRVFNEINYSRPSTLPPVLSIDEFKGNAAGQKYQVILTDPETHKILDILPKRDTTELAKYFAQFPRYIRNNVKYITMDMSLQFRSVMKTWFPQAEIVVDRFHLIRLVTFALERVRKVEQNLLCNVSRTFKANKRVLTKRFESLTDKEFTKLMDMFHYSPRLHRAYTLKQSFSHVLKFKDKENIQWAIDQWLSLVEASELPEFQSLLKTFTFWRTEIINALTLPYSNGFTEGCNNKIKVLKRCSFGLQNFERFRNRILFINAKKGHATTVSHVLSKSA
ncbi:ISL3 family transposase [Veillonella criceti]|uniref:Transposase and inactivated derivatives n=1 Tax=Veillonella criceti TaxID=103891 RepID=A0A380NFX0_9FIRM|nr:ISL3 family transposase [Veillonella criceti]SUP40075.1 Transposase and inactivated derivatives [Veillonella criceti]SUP41215.1 Transposase and inactivated derivatives [Veillonella criceti]SUP44151.1 Transposase and inactivated derivatives [Veillonella criceti]